ncbi:metal-dependent hydrolase, beta-lactamase superfamily II [Geotalea daltonii FRC-32]|uniref:Metal-dependent hydrolase, beta-lactamase superfamily II n=1 Tax=Geotalea daltonii (strain DSM 22248 / JCM 15807 / FRC-32) TaxID=316067 RepID=B9LZN6_GEODF|nr:MBL fold metallo-hydrolase [Geotalea daltonii]ACM18850.1 metal-dependent hydrolase, beta-lactamase superfamily II [Geotalea daltonii FRC-32]
MKGRITVLCDNGVGPLAGTLGEHGFAALIETASGSLLFDTGQGATLLHNAQRMQRDLRRVDKVAISHGHYDHTGGLWPLLQWCGPKRVYGHEGIFAGRYTLRDGEKGRSIGMPYSREFLEGQGASFDLDASFREIAPDIFLSGEVPRKQAFEQGDTGLFCDAAGCIPDQVPDDQSLVLKTGKGLVLVLGCCHSGMINTLELVRERTGETRIYAVIGGNHLGFSSQAQLNGTVKMLGTYGIEKICGSHCAGFAASARLMKEFPGKFHPAQVGYTLEM